MIALVLFVAFWVVIAVGLVLVGVRGGAGGASPAARDESPTGRRAMSLFLAITYVGFGAVVPFAVLDGNHLNASKQFAGLKLTASEKRGRELFGEHCGVCHTLTAANAVGKVGPNLDTLQPPVSLIASTIANGCLQNAPSGSPQTCLGEGTMPSGIVAGRDATDVANFIARVAGK
jgi:mono/diheme cytochrome c family protein